MKDDKLATSSDEIIREAKERMKLSMDAESGNRADHLAALKFVDGDQWPNQVMDDRRMDGRPCLTVNITDAVTRRVKNACRENRPRIKIDPVGDGADQDVAKVLNGLTRHTERISAADYAYDCAQASAIDGGWGWLSVSNEYVDDDSFDQEIIINAHRNPLKIYHDPASEMPDGSDMTWLIESEMMKRTDYKKQYGDIDPGGWEFIGPEDNVANWSHKEEIRVAKYWRVEKHNDTLLKLVDGKTAFLSDVDNQAQVIDKRRVERKRIKCYLMTSRKVLKQWEWPGKWIPYVPVYGRQTDINGRVRRKGMVKDLMDPARMYNYSETAKTETYGLQPKAPWLMPKGSMGNNQAGWRDANRKPVVALEYEQQYSPTGEPLPPPIRQNPPPLGAGFQEWSQSSQSNFMAVAGMPHEPNQDAKGEVVSGIALKKREGLADISHFDFYDNFTRSLRQLGCILLDLYPKFYSTARMQRIVRDDGTSEMVPINMPTQMQGPQGPYMEIKNNLQVGRYDVSVDTGPAYATKRQESAEAKLELLATPLGEIVATHCGDLVLRSMDFENSDEMADRLQALIPGAAQMKQLKNMGADQLKSMVQGLYAQLQQAQQQLQAAGMELKFKSGIEQIKQQGEDRREVIKQHAETDRKRAELATRVHDTDTKSRTAIKVAEIGAESRDSAAEINAAGKIIGSESHEHHEHTRQARELEHDAIKTERTFAHEANMGERQMEHESTEAKAQRKHESTEGQHQRGHEARQSSADRNAKKPIK